MHVCAGGVGLSFVARAKGTGAMRRIGLGVLVGLWGLSGGLPNSITHQNSDNKRSAASPRRATKADPVDAVKDVGRAILATIPFAAAAFRKRAQRFSARHVVGLTFGSACLVGAALCDVRPRKVEYLWRPIETYSRHPGLFLGWCHWFGYVLLGGGPLALLAGPGAMLAVACYADLPALERECAAEVGPLAYREQQRTVSAFWPIKFSNRYVSDRRLYESIPALEGGGGKGHNALLGEWVVEHEFRPWTDRALGRVDLHSDDTAEGANATTTGVLVCRGATVSSVLEVRFTDGRAFQMRAQAASKFVLEPLEVEVTDTEMDTDMVAFWMRLPEMFANWMAADSWRLDPNECWILQSVGEGDEAFVVLSDGDMKTRHLILRRPGNVDGKLGASVLTSLVDGAREAGFGR
jgi:hypothetical protein